MKVLFLIFLWLLLWLLLLWLLLYQIAWFLFQGLTPLHLAAQSGYDNAIEQLVREFSKCEERERERERERMITFSLQTLQEPMPM